MTTGAFPKGQTPPGPAEVPSPVSSYVPLSWGISEERTKWSAFVFSQLLAQWGQFSKATDIKLFRKDWDALNQHQRINVLGELICQVAKYESSWDPSAHSVDVGTHTDANTWSVGLMQMSVVDQESYGFKLGYTYQDLLDPVKNLTLALLILGKQIDKYGVLAIPAGSPGLYWATLHPGGKYDQTNAIADAVSKFQLSTSTVSNPQPTPVVTHTSETPWMDWFKARLGWTEFDHDAELSKGWKYTNVPNYKTVIGNTYAWCAMSLNTALETNNYQGTSDAGADSFAAYGSPCDYIYGAIIPIRHLSGAHHVTTFVEWVDKANKIAHCLGGNQNNSICIATYNLSGNASGHDQVVESPRWPVKK